MENTDVKRFIRIYTHLDDVTGEVNRYFDFFVFYLIGTCLEELVFLTGLVYRGQEMGLAKTMVTASFELLMTLVAAASVIHTCQHISDQADRCNSVLLNHLINNPSTSNSHDLSSLTHLSMKNGLTLKLLKSIPINYSLGTSIITAYITYTIVRITADRCNRVLLNHLVKPRFIQHLHIHPLVNLSERSNFTFKMFNNIPINYSLGTSMIAAYITYVIVLYQFNSKPSDS
ncbi:hypothetical protein GE061_015642 [Apolygus lucorum]|uniref:Gustatory receptor n=1 Tax=Apolygus lucorum TaxID=248454 RepID=A0A8S9XNS8_APOLU|nr:hypothetical protein GE061_015642 [Apolygus lucorum]